MSTIFNNLWPGPGGHWFSLSGQITMFCALGAGLGALSLAGAFGPVAAGLAAKSIGAGGPAAAMS